jgi:uncharacterized protein YutE (UPF0331/DUF86 family)
MKAERINRIVDAVEDIERNVERLRDTIGYTYVNEFAGTGRRIRSRAYSRQYELQAVSMSEYTSDENQDLRDAVERKFEKLTEAVLDIAGELLKEEGVPVPERRKRRLSELEAEGIIEPALADRLRDSVGFRDVLSHTYGPVVNDEIVYEAMQNSLDRYVEFLVAVDRYLSDITEE